MKRDVRVLFFPFYMLVRVRAGQVSAWEKIVYPPRPARVG
jgi:hypothetical protein